jgi:cell division protein FtsW (lipid II flippase)
MIWTIVAAIVASIVLNIAAAIVNPKDANKRDTRDREINQFGERIGQSFVIAGAVAALLLAMAKWEYFWISNAIYLGFVLSALVASGAKIVAYRRGFQKW